MSPRIPLVILGGSDGRPGRLPPAGRDQSSLSGCKGVDVVLQGRPLIAHLVEAFSESGSFGPIYVAGPRAVYAPALPTTEIFDTDSGFGKNIQVAVESARRRHPSGNLAMATCDILPSAGDLALVMDDWSKRQPADLWFPLVTAPSDERELGASAWKPRYVVPTASGERVQVLPGHLTVFDPEAMRLGLLYNLMHTLYLSRNRPILERRTFIGRRMIFGILAHDFLHVVRLRLPTLTWDCLVVAGSAARKLRDQMLPLPQLEAAVRQLFVRRKHRKLFPGRRIHLPMLDAFSLARDIDTAEEAKAFGASEAR